MNEILWEKSPDLKISVFPCKVSVANTYGVLIAIPKSIFLKKKNRSGGIIGEVFKWIPGCISEINLEDFVGNPRKGFVRNLKEYLD